MIHIPQLIKKNLSYILVLINYWNIIVFDLTYLQYKYQVVHISLTWLRGGDSMVINYFKYISLKICPKSCCFEGKTKYSDNPPPPLNVQYLSLQYVLVSRGYLSPNNIHQNTLQLIRYYHCLVLNYMASGFELNHT